jgi:hypothetical protein
MSLNLQLIDSHYQGFGRHKAHRSSELLPSTILKQVTAQFGRVGKYVPRPSHLQSSGTGKSSILTEVQTGSDSNALRGNMCAKVDKHAIAQDHAIEEFPAEEFETVNCLSDYNQPLISGRAALSFLRFASIIDTSFSAVSRDHQHLRWPAPVEHTG